MMKKYYSTFSILVLSILIFEGCGSISSMTGESSLPIEKLRKTLAQKFDDPVFDNAHWGVLIKSLKTGEVMYARNEKKMFMPASNMKLFTTSSATMALTPNYRYYTELLMNGEIIDSILTGDLILKGSGDPTISGRYNGGNVIETFEQWADSLSLLGIKEIRGNVIGDDNCFDDEFYGDGWSADYETDYYAAQVSGISFNDNCVDITITPGLNMGDTCSLSIEPNTRYVTLVNETVTADSIDSLNTILFLRKRGTNTVYVRGSLSLGKKPYLESVTVENPTLYAMTVLKETLESRGIIVDGAPMDVDDIKDSLRYAVYRHAASFTSVPYSIILRTINKPSQNFYAEQVLRTMGKEKYGLGSVKNGRRAAFDVLWQWGVDTTRLQYVDGSGLSRLDLITPFDIVSIFEGISKENEFLPFYESLPIAGVDGTIKNRMKGTRAEGNVHAKTGFIGYVRSLSGYVTSADGEMFVFSMIANNYTVPTRLVEQVQNNVCVELANFSRKK